MRVMSGCSAMSVPPGCMLADLTVRSHPRARITFSRSRWTRSSVRRQIHRERAPAPRGARDDDAPAVLLGDVAYRRETDPRAPAHALGGEERVEALPERPLVHSGTGVPDPQRDAHAERVDVDDLRLDRDPPARRGRVMGVDQEVQD